MGLGFVVRGARLPSDCASFQCFVKREIGYILGSHSPFTENHKVHKID